ncbi:HDIG domain-containing protein [Desulfotomaculum arcticum]|uniref:HDIG domain-containing protein n=1 Tax=Desulfotruncus arcticus DSM 17038 TaxID=1121424 RepID=A0A1I2PFT4_9FIRM|nr:HD domain-containing phosphohydrolase [Desulfotruncus arcticus]SFG12281.1 HDIG domain-containing protein [Desulfotomaculum arcticum] [Desulfotruncus arcticus DSM 17038]
METAANLFKINSGIEEYPDLNEEILAVLNGAVDVLTTICSLIDSYTANHQLRVAQLACAIAEKIGMPKKQIHGLQIGSLLHDIGKVAIPKDILSKYGAISEHEFGIIKSHPQNGYKILSKIKFPWPVQKMVLEHHERMNGTGYPVGLLGDDILLEARIIAVADVVEAISSHRPYRSSLGMETAINEIRENKGVLYDEHIAKACIRLIMEDNFEFSS